MHNADHDRGRMPSRRQFVSLGIGVFALAAAPRLIRPRRRLVRRTVPVMGTIADISVVHRDPRHAHGAIDAAIGVLQRVDRTMTRFRPDSDVGRANAAAARDATRVTGETARVVAEALRWADATGGTFDPAIGKLIAIWDVGRRTEPPQPAVVRRFADRSLYRAVEVGHSAGRAVLRYHDRDVALDLGGIAKGFGVDRAVDVLRGWGIDNAIVNVGGDIYAMGESEDGDAWRVGIRSPENPASLSATFEASDMAVATSGDYEQGFDYRGRRYHHLLDTTTAEPRRVVAHTLTIAADDCMSADAAATALFGMNAGDAGRTLVRVMPGARIIRAG